MSLIGDLYHRVENRIAYERRRRRFAAIFREFHEYTMIGEAAQPMKTLAWESECAKYFIVQ